MIMAKLIIDLNRRGQSIQFHDSSLMSKDQKPEKKSQHERFTETDRALECDEDKKRFEREPVVKI